MPRLKSCVPRYRRHRASGQAIVTLNGRDHYLGLFGTAISKREYDRLIGEWLASGRRLQSQDAGGCSMAELLAGYLRFAKGYYRKNGQPTNTIRDIKKTLGLLRQYYGDTQAADFGPLALDALSNRMIALNWSRGYINEHLATIKRIFKWGASKELVSAEVFHALQTLPGLRKGRTEARESIPVRPVDDAIVNATLKHLPKLVADMVQIQRLTGCRPEEVCMLRPVNVDMNGDVWTYRPESHKTQHHGRERIIMIGPKAQAILRPYLLREESGRCFTPADSERKRRREQHDRRTTPPSCGNRPGTNRKSKPKRTPGTEYTTDAYRRAIHWACDKAFPVPRELDEIAAKGWKSKHRWSPNRLRHSAATEIRKRFGLEAAQIVLGHATADVTQVYAERDLDKAASVARQVG